MHRVLLLGAGKIGRMIVRLLAEVGDYEVVIADADQESLARIASHRIASHPESQSGITTRVVDASDGRQLAEVMQGCHSVLSALSFQYNPLVAEVALTEGLSYFDLTEDVATTRLVRRFASGAKKGQIFMPQCGLAPGFISIVANQLTKAFEQVETVHMRVGALPQFPTGALKYNLTWSTDGLINEYCNPCDAIHGGSRIEVLPLEGFEHFSLDGVRYEAFNTSGGLGTLCETLDDKVRELNYKTVRYQGHRDQMLLLVNELRLNERRDLLKDILEHAVPVTFQDVVVTFCTVTGQKDGQLVQITDARKIYHETIGGENWSAIQITTAAGICTVLDLHVTGQLPDQAFVRQEEIDLQQFLDNRFGRRFESQMATRFSKLSGGETQ